MGNITEPPSISRYVLNQMNLNKMEMEVLEYSGLPRDWIWQTDVRVGQFGQEREIPTYGDSPNYLAPLECEMKQPDPIYIRTIVISDKNAVRIKYREMYSKDSSKRS